MILELSAIKSEEKGRYKKHCLYKLPLIFNIVGSVSDRFAIERNESVQKFPEADLLVYSGFRIRKAEWVVHILRKGKYRIDGFTFVLCSPSLLNAVLPQSVVKDFERFKRHAVILLYLYTQGEQRLYRGVNVCIQLKRGIRLFFDSLVFFGK